MDEGLAPFCSQKGGEPWPAAGRGRASAAVRPVSVRRDASRRRSRAPLPAPLRRAPGGVIPASTPCRARVRGHPLDDVAGSLREPDERAGQQEEPTTTRSARPWLGAPR